ncbi:MAG: hypothetical protein ACK4NF_06455, partial [Planctomycetota bacterium]
RAKENSVYFILKVKDTTQTLNLNDPNPKLINILKNLSEIAQIPMNEEEIEEFVNNARNSIILTDYIKLPRQYTLNTIRSYISLYGKTFDRLLIPSPKKELIGKNIMSVRELVSGSLQLGKRSPININLAPLEVIEAILKDLEGIYIEENMHTPSDMPDLNILDATEKVIEKKLKKPKGDPAKIAAELISLSDSQKLEKSIKIFNMLHGFALPRLHLLEKFKNLKAKNKFYGVVKKHKLSEEKAKQIAKLIFKKRYKDITRPAFYNYHDLRQFLDETIQQGILNELDRDLILANFNPNTDFNKFNPNSTFYKRIDKSDLIEYSTEVVFGPIGTFEVESLGIVERQGDITARKTLIGVFDVLKTFLDTTQKDFSQGIIRPNTSFDYPTTYNTTLETYPQPHGSPFAKTNDFDGQLMLATITTQLTNSHTFLLTFKDSLNADYARDYPYLVSEYFNDKKNIRPPQAGDIFKEGTLYPDGIYTDLTISYPYKGGVNLPFKTISDLTFNQEKEEFLFKTFKVLLGTISFWVKANFETEEGEKTRAIFTSYSLLPGRHKVDRILQYLFQPHLKAVYKETPITTPVLINDFTMPFVFAEIGSKEMGNKYSFFLPDPYFIVQDTKKIPPKYKLKTRRWRHLGIFLDEEGASFTVSP